MPFVYRLYDAADRLLYVGMSVVSAKKRIGQHLIGQPWNEQIEWWHIESHASKAEALAAEAAAVRAEHPLHNIQHNVPLAGFEKDRVEWTEADFFRYFEGYRSRGLSLSEDILDEYRRRYGYGKRKRELRGVKEGNKWYCPIVDFVGPLVA